MKQPTAEDHEKLAEEDYDTTPPLVQGIASAMGLTKKRAKFEAKKRHIERQENIAHMQRGIGLLIILFGFIISLLFMAGEMLSSITQMNIEILYVSFLLIFIGCAVAFFPDKFPKVDLSNILGLKK